MESKRPALGEERTFGHVAEHATAWSEGELVVVGFRPKGGNQPDRGEVVTVAQARKLIEDLHVATERAVQASARMQIKGELAGALQKHDRLIHGLHSRDPELAGKVEQIWNLVKEL